MLSGRKMTALSALLCCAFLLGGCGSQWGWYVVSPSTETGRTNLKFLITGMGHTVGVSLLAIVLSVAKGDMTWVTFGLLSLFVQWVRPRVVSARHRRFDGDGS